MDAAKVFESCEELLKSAEGLCRIAYEQLDTFFHDDGHDPVACLFGARLSGQISSVVGAVSSAKWYAAVCESNLRTEEADHEAES